jgi:CBS domain-containing protein
MTDIGSVGSSSVSRLIGDSVVRIASDATLAEVARVLTGSEIGAVLVGDEERPQALVSERDLVHAVADGRDPATTPAAEVASTELAWCDVDSTVDEVAVEMMDRYIRHVLVEEDGVLVGIVSARDLLGAYSDGARTD